MHKLIFISIVFSYFSSINNQVFSQLILSNDPNRNKNDISERVVYTDLEKENLDFEKTNKKNSIDFIWINIPAGTFTWGENDTVRNIDYDYEIMKYEVTNEQYLQYLKDALSSSKITINGDNVEGYYEGDKNYNAGTYTFYRLNGSTSGNHFGPISWDGSNFGIPVGYENHPVINVTWFGAYAFSKYYGYQLPTEEEWEKAARDNTGWDYPWGNNIDGSRANFNDSGDSFDNGTTNVGYYNGSNYNGFQTVNSPSPYGVYDMAGNIWEWTNSFYSESSPLRVFRGGSWGYGANTLTTWNRHYYDPNGSSSVYGFRCVKEAYNLTIDQHDFWVKSNDQINITGSLKDQNGKSLPQQIIAISDALKNIITSVVTNNNGIFSYQTSTSINGIYHIAINYIDNDGKILASDNALVDVDNYETSAIFRSAILKNETSEKLIAKVEYEGEICYDESNIYTLEQEFTLDPNTELFIIDGRGMEYSPYFIDKTPGEGPPDTTSIGRQYCLIQHFLGDICFPHPDDPNSQVFSATVGQVFNIGALYDRTNKDFCISLGASKSLPYVISGSAALNFCSNGINLSFSSGVGIEKATYTVKIYNYEESEGMDAITTYIEINSPINPYLTDPLGRHVGIDPITNQFINEIPFATYTGPNSDPQVINIPYCKMGDYNLSIEGNGEGSYLILKRVTQNEKILEEQILDGFTKLDSLRNTPIKIDTTRTSPEVPTNLVAKSSRDGIELNWEPVTMAVGYKIYYDDDTTKTILQGKGIPEGDSPINVGNRTNYKIGGLDEKKEYCFTVTAYDENGIQSGYSNKVISKVATFVGTNKTIPKEIFVLYPNYPNPFNSTTIIKYEIPVESLVDISIYNARGQIVSKLVHKIQEAGLYSIKWNGINLPSGLYICRMKASNLITTKKLLLLQ